MNARAQTSGSSASADDVVPIYDRLADDWDRLRDRTLAERPWLDRMLSHAPGRRVLDLGCGSGLPVARYLVERGRLVTGLDAAPAMLDRFRANVPKAEAVAGDLRDFALGRPFDALLAWDSLFHLSPTDQRRELAQVAAHAAPGAALLFTSGPDAGETVGRLGDAALYHASLSPRDYRGLLIALGFTPVAFVPQDATCGGRSVWLARFRRDAA